jgi:hypothetical protein
MTATIIDFTAKRREFRCREHEQREAAFDRELRRRLAVFLDGGKLPNEPISDNPYLDVFSAP